MEQEKQAEETRKEENISPEEQEILQEPECEEQEAPKTAGTEPEAETEAETAEQTGEAETDDAGDKEGGKSIFKKKKKEDKKDIRIAELEDRVKRQLAEFENYRNRTEKEKTHMYEVGARDVLEKILPVVDNFERGLAAIPEEQKEDPFAEGMDKIYKQLMDTLQNLGVTAMESVGTEFDPAFHNAVMHVEDEALGENVVAEEFQKGYKYRENVLRHAMVKVAN